MKNLGSTPSKNVRYPTFKQIVAANAYNNYMEFLLDHSLLSLFILSFLAATLLPVGSEWYLILLIHRGADFSDVVTVATFGNYLGACTTYLVGLWGSTFITQRIFRITPQDLEKARAFYSRFGSWSLLLSWLPVIGDPLCVIGGIFRVGFLHYSILVFSGKFARYLIVAYLVRMGIN
jgi:membrane protein YqaA with SNARE-associated domain